MLKAIVCILLLAATCSLAKKVPRWWLKVAQKQGPNACVVEEVPGTGREFWTECRYWLNRRICGKKTLIRFECCEGFEQIEGENGCALVKPLKNILETAESLGATKWVRYIRDSGLENELESSGAYTLFAPTNQAFELMSASLKSQFDSYMGNPNNPIIHYHIVNSKLRSEDFDGDQTIETRHQGHNIRINKYSNGMTTINCALLLKKDQEATNGIVHLIDGVLDPSVGISNNVAEMILNDGRFQVLALMLEKSGYINVLRTLQDSITILAPSDEAFQKLPDSRREKIINDREARLAILQNHVIPHVICESAITGEHRVRTMSNNRLTFNCDVDGAYVETTKMKGNFNLGKNGIIHMIDNVLLPDRAKNLIELAESRNLETFVQFVKRSGLEETLSHTGDYTFFVPDEAAWLEMPPETLAQSRRDPEFAGLMLRFHGAYGRHLTNAITDNQAIMSLDEENPVRLQVWRKALGVEDAKIIESDIEAQNGVIHIINKVIFPSNRTLEATLNTIPGYSFNTFMRILNGVNSTITLRPGEEVFYTFFIPTDRAFSNMDQNHLRSVLADSEQMKQLIESHVAVNMFPEISFEPGLTYSIDGIGGPFIVKKSHSEEFFVNGGLILESHISVNGVIHIVDSVLPSNNADSSGYSTYGRTYYNSKDGERHSTRTTYTTHHRTVTLNEGYENDLNDILPAYPKGSVIAGSKKRRTSYALLKKFFPRRRAKKFRTKKLKRPTETAVQPEINKEKVASDHKTITEDIITQKTTLLPYTNSTLLTKFNSSSNSSSIIVKNDRTHNTTTFNLNKNHDSKISAFDTYNISDKESERGHYNYSGTIYAYPGTLSGSRYDTYFANMSNSFPKVFGFTYNYSWPGSSQNDSGFNNLMLPLPKTDYNRLSYLNFTKNSSSHQTSFNKLKKFNTIGPVSPAGGKISYVGHPYGDDVAGHGSQFLPFSSAGHSFVSRNSTNESSILQGEDRKQTTKQRKLVHKTQTTYTYPSGTSSIYLTKSTQTFVYPDSKTRIVSTNRNKTSPHFVSAYAFTGDDDNFADGTEFSEARRPSEQLINVEQAKVLRHQWRRKQHHKNRKMKHRKLRRRNKKYRGRTNRD